ncbi:recombinase family protein [Chloroflexota bacterium]
MDKQRPLRACLWLRVSTDSKGQDPELQRADLERVYDQRGWKIVKVYEVEESAFGKTLQMGDHASITSLLYQIHIW